MVQLVCQGVAGMTAKAPALFFLPAIGEIIGAGLRYCSCSGAQPMSPAYLRCITDAGPCNATWKGQAPRNTQVHAPVQLSFVGVGRRLLE